MFLDTSLPLSADAPQLVGECASATGETRIEVVARQDENGGTAFDLVEYCWGSGLGWYPRKRLTIDAEQASALAAVLALQLAPPPAPAPRKVRPAAQQDGNVIRLQFPTS